MSVPALTINKVCLSGLNAVALADQLIRAGECEIVVAGGMESMTLAPHLLPKSRSGFKYGNVRPAGPYGLRRTLGRVHRPADGGADRRRATPASCRSAGPTRTPSPPGRTSGRCGALSSGVMAEEIVEVRVPQRRGDDLVVAADEGIREGVTAESLAVAAAGVRQGRDDHRRLGQPDLRRGGGAGGDQPGGGRAARGRRRWPRSARTAWWPGRTPPCSCSRPTRSGSPARSSRSRSGRPGPDRDQRGVRRGRRGQCPGARAERGADRRAGERQRRRDRARASDRRLRRPAGA